MVLFCKSFKSWLPLSLSLMPSALYHIVNTYASPVHVSQAVGWDEITLFTYTASDEDDDYAEQTQALQGSLRRGAILNGLSAFRRYLRYP